MISLSLFSGCGGLDLGLEQVGIQTACLVEIDPDCAKVYKARCSGLQHMKDVRGVTAKLGPFDIVAGGFPCRDLSYAGRGAGLDGDKSGLWFEMIRVVRELEPRLVVVENVPGLLTRGIVVVIHDLARAGYAGRWFTTAAADVGAPHRRERVFMVAKRVAKRGEELAGPNPSGLFSDDGWVSPQETLFDQDFLDRLGKRGRWSLDGVYEEDSRLALDDDDEMLLPTPNAMESTPTPEYVQEVKDADVQPDARLYLPGRKWHAQRTLSRVAPTLLPTPVRSDGNGLTDGESRDGGLSLREIDALLPTPGAWLGRRPENATADPQRAASRDHEGIRGKRSVELPDALAAEVDTAKLLPTPTTSDQNDGPSNVPGLRDGGPSLRESVRLLPTPTTQDGANTGGPSQMERNSLPLNAEVKLMPTPNAGTTPQGHGRRGGSAGNGHQSGADLDAVTAKLLPTPTVQHSARRSTARTDDWISHPGTTLTDALWELEGRETDTQGKLLPTPLLPTPTAADGDRVSEQGPRFYAGGGDNPTLLGAARKTDGEGSAWGVYDGAIRRWETAFGRSAPPPTDEKSRLSPAFVEWMLGYPEGWTDVKGVTRTARLRMLGNSVQVQVGARVGLALLALDKELA